MQLTTNWLLFSAFVIAGIGAALETRKFFSGHLFFIIRVKLYSETEIVVDKF